MLGCFTPDILVNLHKKLHLFCQFYRWVAWGSKRLSDLPKISEWLDVWVWTFGQDGGVGRHTVSSHNQNKDNNKFKNKKQPELTENQTIWKSDNQGVKEETFIQTSRRGGDGQPGGEDTRQGSSWWTRWQTMQPRVPARGNKASNLWLKTPVGVEAAVGETPSLTEFVGETGP